MTAPLLAIFAAVASLYTSPQAPGHLQATFRSGLDADLEARFTLSQVPGTRFVAVSREAGTPRPGSASVAAKAARCQEQAAGLCDINWSSAPPAFLPLPLPHHVETACQSGQAEVLLSGEDGSPLIVIVRGSAEQPSEVLLAFDLDAHDIAQPGAKLRRWPYLNYLLHAAACAATGKTPPRFSDWEHSPLPGKKTRQWFVGALLLMWIAVLLLYRWARKRGRAAKDDATHFLSAVEGIRKTENAQKVTPAEPQGDIMAPFSRPLSGLLTLLAGMVVLTGPYFAMQSLLTRHVQPFPEANGLWRYTCDTLYIVWLTFDLGTQTAFVKYFAEHRVNKPEVALHDVQFYVWFQIFSRLIEASLLVGFALGYLPGSAYARYMPFVLLYAAACQPAFPAVGKFLCQAIQRFDYYNILDFLESRLLGFLVPLPFILLGRALGRSHPEYGESYGAALGMGLGGLFTTLSVLVIGLYAMHRLGMPLKPIFLAQFRKDTVRRQLWFGFKLTIGQEPFRLTTFIEGLILIRWLRDSDTWLGLKDLLDNRLTMLAFFAWSYYQSAVPVFSEAMAAQKRQLMQYYVARYLQFGSVFAATIFSLLCSVGPLYIERALGAQWSQAVDYLVIAAASGLLLPWAWLTDSLQQGAGRPGTTTVVMLCEQGLRLLLLLVFIKRFQFLSIYLATLFALLLKIGIAWTLNHRRIVPLRIPLWQTILAPHLCGLVNYCVWHGLALSLAPQSAPAVLALFLVAGAGSIGLSFFLLGLLGGLDGAARRELAQASRMVALVGPLCRGLAFIAEHGAKLSPWQPPPLPGWQAAQKESTELNAEAKARRSSDPLKVK